MRQAVPLQPMEAISGADIHLQHMDPTPEQVDSKRTCDPVESLCWSRLLAGFVDSREKGAHTGDGLLAELLMLGCVCVCLILEQPEVPEGLHALKGPTLEPFLKNCIL